MSLYPPGRPKRYDPVAGKGTMPPHAPGEYRIRDGKTNAILYIGETCDLRRRMQEHLRSGKIRQFIGRSRRRTCWFEYKEASAAADSRTRRTHEQKKIRQHAPALNRSGGGEGRIAGK